MRTAVHPDYVPGRLTVHRQPGELARVTRALRATGRTVAFVPTMGALHAGHRELLRRARRAPGSVTVTSIFVNPLQFGPDEDLARYPRPLEADLEVCREEGVELVLHPPVDALYPTGADTTVHPGRLGEELEGALRPGHFAGVLTVMAKLLHVVAPDTVYFGEKDYQQLVLVRRMVRDLDFGVRVVGVPTVREPSGLALSSRNAYLDAGQRAAAVALSAALTAGRRAGSAGGDAVLAAAREVVAAEPALELEYLELRDPDLCPAPRSGPARLLLAARLGATHLIDNAAVSVTRRP